MDNFKKSYKPIRKFNESPDVVGGEELSADGPAYGAEDSVTFALFNNFYLYSLEPICTHGDLYVSLIFIMRKEEHPIIDIHKIKYGGDLSEEEKNKIKNLNKLDRTPFLKSMPNVIQGRLWTESKIISFWNDLAQITARKNNIISFIKINMKMLPQKFQYEIKDKLYSYDEFLSGDYADNTEFDPKTLHTLEPDKKAKALKSIGYVPKKPTPLHLKQMIQGESFKSWVEKIHRDT